MNLLLIILLALSIVVLLSFTAALRIFFTFNSDKSKMDLTLLWLYPFLKVIITNEESGMMLMVYLFNKKVYKKPLKAKKRKTGRMELLQQVKPSDVNVQAYYGFRDPFITGVACGAISIASQFINIDSISQEPDFVADKDYIYVDATAKVNLGLALVNLYRSHR